MNIAIIENNSIVKIGEHTFLFPNVSFPVGNVSQEFLIENSALEVVDTLEVLDSTKKIQSVTPFISEGKVYTVEIVDKTQQDFEHEYNILANGVRTHRNQLLKDSDWTQVADVPVDKQVWAEYRQQLRDITTQSGFPTNVVFPQLPQ